MSESNSNLELPERASIEPGPEPIDTSTEGATQNFVKTKMESQLEMAVDEIKAICKKSAECYVSLALSIKRHSGTDYGIELKTRLEDERIMKEVVYSMFKKIGSSKILTDPQNVGLLPRSYNTLYHLAKLGEEKLQELFEKGQVRSCMRVDELRKLRQKKQSKSINSVSGKPVEDEPRPDSRKILITVSQENWDKHLDKISDLLDQLRQLGYLNLDLDEEIADV